MPKAPSKYNPFRYKDLAKIRRNLILNNLKENNYITESELIEFKAKEITLKKEKLNYLTKQTLTQKKSEE